MISPVPRHRNTHYMKHLLAICTLAGLLTINANASITFQTLGGSMDGSSESVSADAVFTLGNGTLTIVLDNLQENPTSAGQLLSGVSFDISGLSGSGSLSSVNSGSVTTISSSGSYTTGTADSLSVWKATHSGQNINLTALTGGKTKDLIIGPDSHGG